MKIFTLDCWKMIDFFGSNPHANNAQAIFLISCFNPVHYFKKKNFYFEWKKNQKEEKNKKKRKLLGSWGKVKACKSTIV